MGYIKILYLFVFVLLITACDKKSVSIDFTQEGSFTDGIEGPATDKAGNIYAVNFQEQGTIGKTTPNGESTIFLKLPNGSIGNGIRFGKDGTMYVADYTNHNILSIDMATKEVNVFAHDSTANQPNDITIAPNQTIYASDPNWAESTGNIWKITKENGFELLESNMGTTNGIEVSPNGKKLYVNESVQRRIWEYDILEDGSVANKKELISFPDFGMDGMRCDPNGNLYVCRFGKGTVVILNPKGEIMNEVQMKGKNVTNITFSPKYDKFYVTVADRGCIEVVNL